MPMSASRRSGARLPSEPTRRSTTVALVVVAVVIGLLVGLRFADRTEDAQPLEAGVLVQPEAAAGPDPFEVYEDALAARRPIYVLFYSGACEPCVEAEDRSTSVLSDYEEGIVYVSAHTVDPRTQPLFERFSFRSVPTAFFVDAAGAVVGEEIGPLSETELRERLDALVAER